VNQTDVLLETLGSSYSQQFAYNFKALFVPFPVSLTDHLGYVESGIATYSTYRVSSAERQQFPGSFSWPLRIANLKRSMMVSVLPIEGSSKSLIVVNLHMSAYDNDGSLRAQEMAFLKSFMEEQTALGNYVIIGGDFNQTFPEADGIYVVPDEFYVAYPIEDSWLPNGYQYQVDINSPSCRLLNQPYNPSDSNTQYYIIDGFIISNNIMVEIAAETLDYDFLYSDHNPVILTIKLIP
jgi:endonuclease/exonuclease/phosphatase family metal-dependent hydrolase